MGRRLLHIIGVLSFTALACQAGEFAVLISGSRLPADRHQVEGDRIRLFHNGGETQLPAALIARFEDDGRPAPPMPAETGVGEPTVVPVVLPLKTAAEFAAHAAKTYSLPEAFVRSVMRAESGFQLAALSPKGAIGLMQLMPATARSLGVDPHDPQQNALGGARYLRELLERYEGRPDQVLLALAAYNAGPAAVEKYHGVPPFAETRQYIWRVVERWTRESAPK